MRNKYNLSHLAHLSGHIGRIQTITVIPVVAGDSLEINISGLFRLAPLRKEIVSECQIDICAFYVPHRHIWPEEWPFLVTEGLQTETILTAGPNAPVDAQDPFYLGIHTCGSTVNKSLIRGHNAIYQRYYAVPSTAQNGTWQLNDLDFYPDTMSDDHMHMRRYGPRAARLPHILNGGTTVNSAVGNAKGYKRDYSSEDWGVEIPQDVPSAGIALLDIRDLAKIKQRYRSVQQQNYFAQFYNDVMGQKWGSQVNTDADPRPTLLARDTHFVSGRDVDGTDDATLGTQVGKTIDQIRFSLPRRFMPEHGNVWVQIVPRFPLVHNKEQHPILAAQIPDNKLLLGDPDVWAGETVVPFDPGQWMAGGSIYTPDVDRIQQPYGQEYRYQPNRIHPDFADIPGYPFTQWDTANQFDWYYYKDNEYVETFQTSQVGQWQAHLSVGTAKFSSVIDPKTSIFVGAN